MLRTERVRKEALEKTIAVIVRQAGRSVDLGFDDNAVVLNLALFFLIADRDIQAVKVDALTHPDAWQRGLAARVMLLTLHELDLDKAAGKSFNDVVQQKLSPELAKRVAMAMRDVRRAQRRAVVEFSHLRDSTIAHRDRDALAQYRDITAINALRVNEIASDFYAATSGFLDAIPQIFLELGTPGSLIAQLIVSRERRQVSGRA